MQRTLSQFLATLLAASGLTLATAATVTSGTATAVAAKDRDCSSFATQAAAQSYFIQPGGPQDDPDRLDEDGDGVACESNPCPCSSTVNGGDGDGGGEGGGGGGQQQAKAKRQPAEIVRIVDGDTVVADLAEGPNVDVRLLGIDTPELKGNECGATEATSLITNLLPIGTKVLLVSDPTQSLQDRYGRLLRYVQRGRTETSLTILKRGFARVLTVGKPFQRMNKYRTAQRQAKRADRGLWSSCY